MEKIKKAFISIFSILLVVVVAFGIARGVTGAWNPKDWGKSKGSSSTERDDDTSTTPVVPDPPAPTINPNVISKYTEVTFTERFYDAGRWLIQTPEKINIFTEAGCGRAYFATNVFRGDLTCGLKLETDTEITFEISEAMDLSIWLDKVEQGAHESSLSYPSYLSIRIDGYRYEARKVSGDLTGYHLNARLSAGKHTIRKGDACVLSYLCFEPVD